MTETDLLVNRICQILNDQYEKINLISYYESGSGIYLFELRDRYFNLTDNTLTVRVVDKRTIAQRIELNTDQVRDLRKSLSARLAFHRKTTEKEVVLSLLEALK